MAKKRTKTRKKINQKTKKLNTCLICLKSKPLTHLTIFTLPDPRDADKSVERAVCSPCIEDMTNSLSVLEKEGFKIELGGI